MNEMDEAIMHGAFPAEPASDVTPALPGHSYYWDCRAEGLAHETAVRKAARQMGCALGSIASVQRAR